MVSPSNLKGYTFVVGLVLLILAYFTSEILNWDEIFNLYKCYNFKSYKVIKKYSYCEFLFTLN